MNYSAPRQNESSTDDQDGALPDDVPGYRDAPLLLDLHTTDDGEEQAGRHEEGDDAG